MKRLKEALHTSFIDRAYESLEDKQVKLLSNSERKIITTLRAELSKGQEFFISVAFITESGVSLILNELKELKRKGVRGRILTGTYLNFTQPKAIRRLMEFKNIDVRLYDRGAFHAKGYFFKEQDEFSVILGSSNLTASALTTNDEWNIYLKSNIEGKFTSDMAKEFASVWIKAEKASKIIDEYEDKYNLERDREKKVRSLIKEHGLEDEGVDKIIPNFMQKEALSSLKALRNSQKKRSLLISATGTGKTYLSAFDVREYNPKRFLFIVHRENIAKKAMETFKKVIPNKSMGLYTGSTKDKEADYLFATIQTMSREEHFKDFSSDHFDYIVIDEVHHSGAKSYQKILDYFDPKFLLGMTATPERTDALNIYELFDFNIAYEIRLYDALDYNLLTPFHYFGIADYEKDGLTIDEKSDINDLLIEERIDHIIEKSKYYGYSGNTLHGLIFVSRVEEAVELERLLNIRGLRVKALTGSNSESEREVAIEDLEAGRLEYLITVDIFNEGIDIPCINQVILLRPTESSIVYIQQLGRGLRLSDNKEYVTILDFIGNYKKSFLNIVALSQNNRYNKEELNRFLISATDEVPGPSSIAFDEVSKERIFEQIKSTNFSNQALIKHDYELLSKRINRTPLLYDFFSNNMICPNVLLKWKDNYKLILDSLDKNLNFKVSEKGESYLTFISKEYTPNKRVHEMEVINQLLKNTNLSVEEINREIEKKYGLINQYRNTRGAILQLAKEIFTKDTTRNKYEPIISLAKETVTLTDNFKSCYDIEDNFKVLVDDLIKYNLAFTMKNYLQKAEETLILYRNYGRKEIHRLINYDYVNGAIQPGYPLSKDADEQLIFITLDDSSSFTSYDNRIDSEYNIPFYSTGNRKLNLENDILNKESKLALNKYKKIRIFIRRRSNENFYYIGDVGKVVSYEETISRGKPCVKYVFKLKKEIPFKLKEYMFK